jgi:signal transduction histidine kinase
MRVLSSKCPWIGLGRDCVVPSPRLTIALIEPNAAYAAEMGQLLSEVLKDFSFELCAEKASADIILMDEIAPLPTEYPQSPMILFGRSLQGGYTAHALRGGAASGNHIQALTMPLMDLVRCVALVQVTQRTEAQLARPDPAKASEEAARFQHRLLQAQKMEAVGELAGGIAHDFNNLILVIRSYSEMLLEEKTLSPDARHHAQEILTASQRASDLTSDLLAFSRKHDMELLPTSLNGVIDTAVPMLSRLVGKNITVWVQLPQGLWTIRADAAQLEQVLVNLAANARDAMPHGGKLLLETTNVVIEDKHAAMPPGEYVMLAVSDTGSGIPRHVLPRIFEPFFTTKERGKGTGLGLASVYGIVKHSGGYIWAYSESGYGTTFKIYLPRTAAAEAKPEASTLQFARAASNSAS